MLSDLEAELERNLNKGGALRRYTKPLTPLVTRPSAAPSDVVVAPMMLAMLNSTVGRCQRARRQLGRARRAHRARKGPRGRVGRAPRRQSLARRRRPAARCAPRQPVGCWKRCSAPVSATRREAWQSNTSRATRAARKRRWRRNCSAKAAPKSDAARRRRRPVARHQLLVVVRR